jgi:hypothetical protein
MYASGPSSAANHHLPNYPGGPCYPYYPQQQPAHPVVGNSMYPGGPLVGFNLSVMSGTPYQGSFNGYPGGNPVGILPPCPGGLSFGGYGHQQPPQQPMYNVTHFYRPPYHEQYRPKRHQQDSSCSDDEEDSDSN